MLNDLRTVRQSSPSMPTERPLESWSGLLLLGAVSSALGDKITSLSCRPSVMLIGVESNQQIGANYLRRTLSLPLARLKDAFVLDYVKLWRTREHNKARQPVSKLWKSETIDNSLLSSAEASGDELGHLQVRHLGRLEHSSRRRYRIRRRLLVQLLLSFRSESLDIGRGHRVEGEAEVIEGGGHAERGGHAEGGGSRCWSVSGDGSGRRSGNRGGFGEAFDGEGRLDRSTATRGSIVRPVAGRLLGLNAGLHLHASTGWSGEDELLDVSLGAPASSSLFLADAMAIAPLLAGASVATSWLEIVEVHVVKIEGKADGRLRRGSRGEAACPERGGRSARV